MNIEVKLLADDLAKMFNHCLINQKDGKASIVFTSEGVKIAQFDKSHAYGVFGWFKKEFFLPNEYPDLKEGEEEIFTFTEDLLKFCKTVASKDKIVTLKITDMEVEILGDLAEFRDKRLENSSEVLPFDSVEQTEDGFMGKRHLNPDVFFKATKKELDFPKVGVKDESKVYDFSTNKLVEGISVSVRDYGVSGRSLKFNLLNKTSVKDLRLSNPINTRYGGNTLDSLIKKFDGEISFRIIDKYPITLTDNQETYTITHMVAPHNEEDEIKTEKPPETKKEVERKTIPEESDNKDYPDDIEPDEDYIEEDFE